MTDTPHAPDIIDDARRADLVAARNRARLAAGEAADAGDDAALALARSQLTAIARELDNLPTGPQTIRKATGRTYAQEWERLDALGRRELLLSIGVRVVVAPAFRVPGLGTWTPLDNRLTIEVPEWLEQAALAALEQS
jgi:hypothetical protein